MTSSTKKYHFQRQLNYLNYLKKKPLAGLSVTDNLYNTYDPLFTVAADAVRQVFKAEPVAEGRRRTTEENTAAVALTAIMKDITDITDTKLAQMLLKKCHSAVGSNMRKHWDLYETNPYYMAKWIEVLTIVNEAEL